MAGIVRSHALDRAIAVEADGASQRHGGGWGKRVAPIDQGVHGPLIGASLAIELLHGVLVTLAVVHLGRERLGVSRLIGRIERQVRHHHASAIVHFQRDVSGRRIQVDALVDQRCCLWLQRRRIDLQIGEHALLDLASRVGGIALQAQAVRGNHEVVLAGLESTRTGVHARAVIGQHEEALPLNPHVQHVAGGVDVTLGELLGNGCQAHAITHLVLAHAQAVGAGVDIGELGTRRLEAVGVDVGDVVAGDIQLLVCCVQTAKADIERHEFAPFAALAGLRYRWFARRRGTLCQHRRG
ncbi:hypothetical protein D3C75_737560 [compost metagenome]